MGGGGKLINDIVEIENNDMRVIKWESDSKMIIEN